METDSCSKTNEPEAQRLDLRLCVICQRNKKKKTHKYGPNIKYTEEWNKLRFTSVQELEDGQASWHRSCYMLGCLDEQEKGMKGSLKALM